MRIPVVDFEVYKLGVEDVADEGLRALSAELKSAFTEVGFAYLKNTGISQQEIDAIMDISKKFFLLPEEEKLSLLRGTSHVNHGYVRSGTERLNACRPCDLKESFNITPPWTPSAKWPSEELLPGFQEMQMGFFQRCKELSLHVLRVLGLSLGLDSDIFLCKHTRIGDDQNGTTLRILNYPPVKAESVEDGQVRCGEHSDFGTFTMVFQGPGGGLQVLSRSGEYISAPTISGTILINIADLLQRWTSDVFVSAVHRVMLPPSGEVRGRQSVVFFVHPDDEATITCCDGSNKYPPVNALEYLNERFKSSYGRRQNSAS